MRLYKLSSMILAAVVVCCAVVAQAITIETVHVGDPGNAGEWSGASYRGLGPDRICGAVGYAYDIGKYEVTAGQYTAFLNAVGGVDTHALYNGSMSDTSYGSGIVRSGGGTLASPYSYTVDAAFINRPVNYVGYWDACRFANWLHNDQPIGAQVAGTTERGAYTLDGYNGADGHTIGRNAGAKWAITSEDEWYKAAYYKSGGTNAGYWDFPTSSDTAPGQDMADVLGNNANYYTDPCIYPIDSDKFTTIAGEFQNSDSPYGTFDQGGNLWERNEAVVYTGVDWSVRGLRGGAFDYDTVNLCASARSGGYGSPTSYLPAHESSYVGFRVVSVVPEPGSLMMLAGIALTALLCWWRKRT